MTATRQVLQYPPLVVPRRDGTSAILVTQYEGQSGDPHRDVVRFSFQVVTSPGAPPHRVVVLLDGLFVGFATPERISLPSGVIKEAGLAHLCVSAMGEVLDASGVGALEVGQPPVLEFFSGDITDLKSRVRASDEDVLRYMAGKLYWGWKYDQQQVEISYPDLWRLAVSRDILLRVMMIGADQYWRFARGTPHALYFEPLRDLLQSFPSGALPGVLESAAPSLVDQLRVPRYAGPRANLVKAQQYLNPSTRDFENAVKEAICAVEGVARIVTGRSSQTLGELIKELRARNQLDGAIAKAFEGLWGFASNAPGVRHGSGTISEAEARLCVDMAMAAVAFLLSRDTT